MCLGFKPGAAGWNVPTNPLTAVPQTIILFEIFFKMGQIVLTLFTHQSLLETLFRFHWIKFRSKCKNISRQKCNKNFYWIFKFRQFSQKCKNFEDAPPPSKKNSNIFWQNSKNGFFLRIFYAFSSFSDIIWVSVWPDSAKFRHFGNFFKVFEQFCVWLI